MLAVVDGEVAEVEGLGRRLGCRDEAPAEGGFDSGDQLGGGERFDDVVGSAGFEGAGDDFVASVGGEEDDGQFDVFENRFHEFDAVAAWEHKVEQDEADGFRFDEAEGFIGVGGDEGCEAGLGEGVAHVAEGHGVVVNDEDLCFPALGRSIRVGGVLEVYRGLVSGAGGGWKGEGEG